VQQGRRQERRQAGAALREGALTIEVAREIQPVSRARDADIQQPPEFLAVPLLLELRLLVRPERDVRLAAGVALDDRDPPLPLAAHVQVHDEHDRELEALGRVQGHQVHAA
jgi:hypothetical protein